MRAAGDAVEGKYVGPFADVLNQSATAGENAALGGAAAAGEKGVSKIACNVLVDLCGIFKKTGTSHHCI